MARKTKVAEKKISLEAWRETDETLRLPAIIPPVTYPIETLVPEVRQQTPAVGQRATRPDGRLHGLGPPGNNAAQAAAG